MIRPCEICKEPIKNLRPGSSKTTHAFCQTFKASPISLLQAPPSVQLVSNIIVDVPRTREEWLAWRMKGIGGSDAPAIMGASPWVSRFDLWAIKTNRMLPQEMNFPMWRGIKLEPEARAIYEALQGVEMSKKCLRRTDFEFARGSYDGLNMECTKGVEIKCPGEKDHLQALAGEIPEKYLWQCVHLCWVGGLEEIDYFSYNPRKSFKGPKIATVNFKRDPKLERTLIKAEQTFWEYVINDKRPPDGGQPRALDSSNIFTLRRRHG